MNKATELQKQARAIQEEKDAARKAQEKKNKKARAAAKRQAIPGLVQQCVTETEKAAAEGKTSTRVLVYKESAYDAVEIVSDKLREMGFIVVGRKEQIYGRIDGDGYSMEESTPYAVWEISWLGAK